MCGQNSFRKLVPVLAVLLLIGCANNQNRPAEESQGTATVAASKEVAPPPPPPPKPVVAIDQQRDALGRLADKAAQLLDTGHRFAVDREQDVAAANSGTSRRSGRTLDQQTARTVELLALLGSQRPHSEAKAVVRGFLAVLAGNLLVLLVADLDLDVALPALAPDLQLGRLARRDIGNERRQFAGSSAPMVMPGARTSSRT